MGEINERFREHSHSVTLNITTGVEVKDDLNGRVGVPCPAKEDKLLCWSLLLLALNKEVRKACGQTDRDRDRQIETTAMTLCFPNIMQKGKKAAGPQLTESYTTSASQQPRIQHEGQPSLAHLCNLKQLDQAINQTGIANLPKAAKIDRYKQIRVQINFNPAKY